RARGRRRGVVAWVGRRLVRERRLEDSLVMRAAALVLLGLAPLGAGGCFDVHVTDPGPLMIDDFDDGDFVPANPLFNPWICFTYNPERSTGYRCDHDAGFESPYSLFLQDRIDDPRDGVPQNGGSALGIFGTSQDVSSYRELVFSAVLESGNPPLPS